MEVSIKVIEHEINEAWEQCISVGFAESQQGFASLLTIRSIAYDNEIIREKITSMLVKFRKIKGYK